MTATKICFLWCNVCETEFASSEESISETRRHAEEAGWTAARVEREWCDWCPHCTANRSSLTIG